MTDTGYDEIEIDVPKLYGEYEQREGDNSDSGGDDGLFAQIIMALDGNGAKLSTFVDAVVDLKQSDVAPHVKIS